MTSTGCAWSWNGPELGGDWLRRRLADPTLDVLDVEDVLALAANMLPEEERSATLGLVPAKYGMESIIFALVGNNLAVYPTCCWIRGLNLSTLFLSVGNPTPFGLKRPSLHWWQATVSSG